MLRDWRLHELHELAGEAYPTGVKPGAVALTQRLPVQRRISADPTSLRPLAGEFGFVQAYGVESVADPARFPDEPPLGWLSAPAVQRRTVAAVANLPADSVHRAAAAGTSGPAGSLPFVDVIQPLFGRHDVTNVRAHADERAVAGARAMGAEGVATGDQIAFGSTPTLHAAAHEAAHVVQQRTGVHLMGGVGAADDRYEQHADAVAEKVVRGQSAEALLDEVAGPRPSAPAAAAPAVQRIVRIGGDNVLPDDHEALVAHCRGLVLANARAWTPAMEAALRAWLVDHDHVIAAPDVAVLAFNVLTHPGEPAAWEHGMTHSGIAAPAMKEAQRLRNVERMARLMTSFETQTGARVPGLGKLEDQDLLRLAETGKAEQQFWERPSSAAPQKVRNLKRKDISGEDEAHITASGLPDDPSYTVAMNSHQLGHRYRGTKQAFIKGGKHERTYGSKREREGYEYKGSGLVDGHSVQVQDDQPILGPLESDAPKWKTNIPRTGGKAPVTYDDAPFLPKDASDERWMETHPHNFYWENQEQGKHMRQKALETPAMNDGTSFLHYNRHTGDQFQPNAGSAQDHLYDIPSRIEYLTRDATGARTHYSADNRPTADYSVPGGYDPLTHSYPTVPSGKASANQNKSLGGVSAFDHLAKAKMPDTSGFPFSTVLKPEDPTFAFKPDWRGEVAGYQSPPASPYYDAGGLAEDSIPEPGDQTLKQHLHHAGGLVTGASYDEPSDKTELSVKRVRHSGPGTWAASDAKFAALVGAASGGTGGPTGGPGGSLPAVAGPPPELVQHQRRIDALGGAIVELRATLDPGQAGDLPALQAIWANLQPIDRNDATTAPQVAALYQQAIAWMQANQGRLHRQPVGGGAAEPANNAQGPHGLRHPALRQFFSECGQMAAHNVLAMAGGVDNEAALDAQGGLEQDIGEDDIRAILVAAARPDLPVIGNLAQLHAVVLQLQAGVLDPAMLAVGELAGLLAIDAFLVGPAGPHPVLNMVVNTTGHQAGLGHHWIAVRLTWTGVGQIAIDYRDSFGGNMDYAGLFAALRAFFGALPVNVAVPDAGGAT